MTEKRIQTGVGAKLRSLRLALRSRLLGEAFAWLVLLGGGLIAASFVLDYTFHLERALRVGVQVVALGVLAYAAVRYLLLPQLVRMDDESLALLVERRHRSLGDRLISALQLSDLAAASAVGMSTAMIRRTAEQADRLASGVRFTSVVETRRLWRYGVAALAVITLLTAVAVAAPNVASLWYRRNILLENVDWPQDTYLAVYAVGNQGSLVPLLDVDEEGTILSTRPEFSVLRGEDLHLVVVASEQSTSPSQVTLNAWYPSVGDTEQVVYPSGEEDQQAIHYRRMLNSVRGRTDSPRRIFHIRVPSLSEEIEFSVSGGDDSRDARSPHRVRLVEAPSLPELRFYVSLPRYMPQPDPAPIDGNRGGLSLPVGASVHVEATASKDIGEAELLLDGETIAEMDISPLEGGEHAGAMRKLKCDFTIDGPNEGRTAYLQFRLQDSDGYVNRRGEKFVLEVKADSPPQVSLRSRGVRSVICPSARIPNLVRADDANGVKEVRVQFQTLVTPPAEEDDPAPSPVTSDWMQVGEAISDPTGAVPSLEVERILDIQPLKLHPGDTLHVRAEAEDKLPPHLDGPNVSQSSELIYRIISKEELLTQLVGRQKEIRVGFEQTMNQQALSQGRCEALAVELADSEITAESTRKLTDAEQKQLAVVKECEQASIRLAEVAEEMELNRVGKLEDIQQVRSRVVQPLNRLLGEDLRRLRLALEQAKQIDNASSLRAEMQRISEEQQAVLRTMDEIFSNMIKMENQLELARRLEGLLKMAVELNDIIRGEVREEEAEIFDPLGEDEETPDEQEPDPTPGE